MRVAARGSTFGEVWLVIVHTRTGQALEPSCRAGGGFAEAEDYVKLGSASEIAVARPLHCFDFSDEGPWRMVAHYRDINKHVPRPPSGTVWFAGELNSAPIEVHVTSRPSRDARSLPSAQEPAAGLESRSGGAPSLEPRDCSSDDATKWLGAKATYRPAGEGSPQIIQGQDYAPIEAVQALYIEASGTRKLGEFGFEDQYEGKAEASRIVVTGFKKSADIELGSGVKIGQRVFSDDATTLLFRTLRRLLADLSSRCTQRGVRGRRLGTRAYRDNVRVEFSYGSVVVSLESASNGPADPERLYVLDLVESRSSALWAESRAASAH